VGILISRVGLHDHHYNRQIDRARELVRGD